MLDNIIIAVKGNRLRSHFDWFKTLFMVLVKYCFWLLWHLLMVRIYKVKLVVAAGFIVCT